jgi:DUF1680 family protein
MDPIAHGPVAPTPSALAALHPRAVARLAPDGLLGGWQARNAEATMPHCVEQLGVHGNLTNLRRVIGEADTPYAGMWFADTDVYKTLEALAWHTGPASPFLADTVALIEKAQDPDGYLNSYYQVDHRDEQWSDLGFSHEMYTAGHLIQAAVASPRLVAVARRFADLLVERYGPGGADVIDGHPEVETALVELYRRTGHRPYLALARRFVELRGHGLLGPGRFGPRYWQDHEPVCTAGEATGHAVRQLYLLAGVVDVAVETHDRQLLAAAQRLWDSALDSKTYLTGGQGSRHKDEAFGDPYELPPDRAYAETCAAIGGFQLAWRLLLATGDGRYADEMERLLHNGIAGSIALDGRAFFYSNPLQLRTGHDGSHEDAPSQRLPWYSCACCPPNLARLMASLHTYAATGDESGLQLHLYGQGTVAAGPYSLEVTTDYPWDERITVTVTAPGSWTLSLRVPTWCTDPRFTADGAVDDGYLRITRTWQAGDVVELTLPMPPRTITPDPRIDAVRGTAALARGPLVYCLEHADLPPALDGAYFEDLELIPGEQVTAVPAYGIAPVTLLLPLRVRGIATTAIVPAIPYFLWANRAPGPMRVWIPLAPREEQPS